MSHMADEPLTGALQLSTVWNQLEEREKRLLMDVAERLLMGQRVYGALSFGKKQWCREALEEAMDGMVYLGAVLQDLSDEEKIAQPT